MDNSSDDPRENQPEGKSLPSKWLHGSLAKGAKVDLYHVNEHDHENLGELLTTYSDELARNHQAEEAQKVLDLLVDWYNTFAKIRPRGTQEDQRYATE